MALPFFSMNYRYSLGKSDLYRQVAFKEKRIRYGEHLSSLIIVCIAYTIALSIQVATLAVRNYIIFKNPDFYLYYAWFIPMYFTCLGYFKTNTNSEVNLDWKPIQFEIVDLETEVNNIPTFKGTDGIERYIVNTKDVYNNIYLIINFFGDFLTSTYGENDVSFSQSVGFALSITEKFIDKLALSITFNTEGRYNITCNVANYHTTLFFEANDELYEMLQVA